MAPSPRKPRVPRASQGAGGDAPLEQKLEGHERGGEARVSLGPSARSGPSAKVTVLRPVLDDDELAFEGRPNEESAASHATNGPELKGAEPKRAEPKGAESKGFAAGGKPPSKSRRRLGKDASSSAGKGSSGAVVAFPVPRAKRLRRRVLAVGLTAVALVGTLMAVLVFSPVLAVRTITVHGTKMLAPAQVTAALGPIEGKPLPLVGPDEVARLLGPIVQIKSVQSRAVPPNTLLVTVVERVPVALVVKQDKSFSVVDGDGVEIAQASDRSAFAVPVIDSGGAALPHATFLAITGVLAALPADILAQLATAKADSVDSVQLRLSNGKTVIWGNSEDRDLKAKVLEALMKATENPVKGQAPVNVYDVSVPRHPVTR